MAIPSKQTKKTPTSSEKTEKVYSASGESVGTVVLNPEIFAKEGKSSGLVHQVATALLSSARNTVASTKTRGKVRGGGRKPHRQKGTGRARAGSIRSPLWVGGGVTFGPSAERNFKKKINKQDRRIALFRVLTDKAQSKKLFVVDKLELKEVKTKEAVSLLEGLRKKLKELTGSVLFITAGKNDSFITATRNLPKVSVKMASSFNILDVLSHKSLVLEKGALDIIEKTYLRR